jgi:hypothetical protein
VFCTLLCCNRRRLPDFDCHSCNGMYVCVALNESRKGQYLSADSLAVHVPDGPGVVRTSLQSLGSNSIRIKRR